MKSKNLKSEIKSLLDSIEKTFGKDSLPYESIGYYFDILEHVYTNNYSEGKDLLRELKKMLNKLSIKMPELTPQQFPKNYPNIDKMINYLDEWLSE